MNTPICDFVAHYAAQDPLRLHMPGHKGYPGLGMEPLDITEIKGADSLYEASGIIRESEENASSLFGAPTFYSTEGSSQCIRAMVYLVTLWAKVNGRRPLIAAGRNAHRSFLSALALCDCNVMWLYPEEKSSYLSCKISADNLQQMLVNGKEKPVAVYLTSPDYLGNMADVDAIAEVCHQQGILLLVDNAHGAYLKFLPSSRHPIDLGADMCCDSAHKTLPVLTGGAYLHVSPRVDRFFVEEAKNALILFGSTSPSYLILQSLDAANPILATWSKQLAAFLPVIDHLRVTLRAQGYTILGDEPLKLTLCPKSYGYTGRELGALLQEQQIVYEFADPDFLVCMLTPALGNEAFVRLHTAFRAVPRRTPVMDSAPGISFPERVFSPREVSFLPRERLSAVESEGRILAVANVGCPPAVPIVVCGERIDRAAIEQFAYYGIEECIVLK